MNVDTIELKPRGRRNACALAVLALASSSAAPATAAATGRQPQIGVRTAQEITVDGLRFKDLNRNGQLDPYEDWRLTAGARAADLVSKMTPQEKAGAMQHGSAPLPGGGFGGGPGGPARAYDLTAAQALLGKGVNSLITRLRGEATALADQNNQLQAIAEASRLGIPLTISTDPRNHFRATVGASEEAGQFSQWPEALGLAATGDPAVTRLMADTARKEYRAVGIHLALSPVADLATEPRWPRLTETFGEDAGQVSRHVGAYVAGFQGGTAGVQPDGVIAVVKHWAGYGAAMDGWDSHNAYGRYAEISEAGLKNHMDAFKGAFDAKVAGVMPTYSILKGAVLDGAPVEQVGVGFSRQMLQDQLRGRYGFKGFVVSDWGITGDCPDSCLNGAKPPARPAIAMPWGVESLSAADRTAKAVNAGVDQIGGSNDPAALIEAIGGGKVTGARIDEAVLRILTAKFQLGLFENP
jgi:beta-glucosidase